ncbi:hypothetical protein GGS23DRAFT_579460 [Durotheca rogersii]|uniref:uncharacterized protein n=1 Tax=Durotheca rogersii TaxID=419775 RepID=UPI00221E5842|nr:uncharacterized protein GGS23DRAFT_579460 [Durotheca rogersii]KAI5860909.1 hypothetical protein GGS23DRAFT_579460 [Durotheca rogersii]
MDLSAALDFHGTWNQRETEMRRSHELVVSSHKELLERMKQEVRARIEHELRVLKDHVPEEIYESICVRMADDSLELKLQRIENSHKLQLEIIENLHRENCDRHQAALQEVLRVETPSSEHSSAAVPTAPDDCTSQKQYDRQLAYGELHLMMRVQSKKRKIPVDRDLPPSKRPRINALTDLPRTPSVTPPVNSYRPLQGATTGSGAAELMAVSRTVTFDEVYREGNAEYKDTIVEWPVGSRNWYILKCEEHDLHFSRNAVLGAAKHLNGLGHGFPDRNRTVAVQTLGYRVLGCTESLVRLNNQAADEAYANGYKPPVSKLAKSHRIARKGKQGSGQGPTKLASTRPSIPTAKAPGALAVSPRPQSVSGPRNGIAHPRSFRIYNGLWRDVGQVCPLVILGWHDRDGSGLRDGHPTCTDLLKQNARRPDCYIYKLDTIVAWAPGYEHGGSKVQLREFPAMFFDPSRTLAWVSAKDLSPLYLSKKHVPKKHARSFGAARRWIAEKEGFKTWEDRERARSRKNQPAQTLLTKSGNADAANRAEVKVGDVAASAFDPTDRVGDTILVAEDREVHQAVAANPAVPAEGEDSDDDRASESDAKSITSAGTEAILEEWREKGGEITDDEDFEDSEDSESEVDNGLALEAEEWNCIRQSSREANNGAERPWAFYSLRSIVDAKETAPPANMACMAQEKGLSKSAAGESTGLTPGLTKLVHSSVPGASSSVTDARKSPESPVPKVTKNASEPKRPALGAATPPEPVTRDDRGVLSRVVERTKQDEGPASVLEGTKSTTKLAELDTTYVASSTSANIPPRSTRSGSSAGGDAVEPLPNGLEAGPPAESPAAVSAPTDTTPAGQADFELSLYTGGDVSWKREDERGGCAQLFGSADRRTMEMRRGVTRITIDPGKISGFWRESVAGSNGNSALVLRNGDGSSSRLVFDRSTGSKLETGKIQARGFIRWLRSVNADIKCLEPEQGRS